jgi:hypothetical protein
MYAHLYLRQQHTHKEMSDGLELAQPQAPNFHSWDQLCDELLYFRELPVGDPYLTQREPASQCRTRVLRESSCVFVIIFSMSSVCVFGFHACMVWFNSCIQELPSYLVLLACTSLRPYVSSSEKALASISLAHFKQKFIVSSINLTFFSRY